jgi:hypothetical protein
MYNFSLTLGVSESNGCMTKFLINLFISVIMMTISVALQAIGMRNK